MSGGTARRREGRVVAKIASRRDASVIYMIRTATAGALSCDCPGFLTSRTKRCRHTDIVDVARQLAPMIND
jgi:hypothetical protein